VNFIAGIMKEEVPEIKNCKFYRLLIDGSTDKSATEQMTYAKYFKDDKFRESFLGTAVLRHHGG
jgi:hypothetical protein